MKVLYLETSALLRLVFGQEDWMNVDQALREADQIFSSRLLKIEAERAVLRLELDRPLPGKEIPLIRVHLQEIWSGTNFLEISAEICELSGRIAPDSRLRPLDAIHLASFESLRRLQPSAEILTFDDSLRAALSREKGKGGSSGTTSSPRGTRRT